MTARDGNIRGFEAAEALGQIRYEPQHLVLYRELSRLGGRRLETPKAHSYQCLRIHDAVLPYDLNRLLPGPTSSASLTWDRSVCRDVSPTCRVRDLPTTNVEEPLLMGLF